ncbi:MAG: hypothetical protein Ct9H300mP28_04510 [Pseudomonadota bacterium]|nr:MAG: hypothetical protein Ct9H300mP28_04510 [Pseudomonadota bacterium]
MVCSIWPVEDPEISGLALVEHGGGGSKAAAPVVP